MVATTEPTMAANTAMVTKIFIVFINSACDNVNLDYGANVEKRSNED